MIKYDIERDEQRIHEQSKYSSKFQNTVARSKNRKEHIDQIKKHFPNAKTVLCLGCRHESEPQQFNAEGYSAFGVDFAGENGEFMKLVDAHDLLQHFKENSFDIVYSSHSMEHMHDAELVLSNIRKVASQGAFIVLPVKPGLGPSHCSVFDVMLEARGSLKDMSLEDLKSSELMRDFTSLAPYELTMFEYMDDRGPHSRHAAKGLRFAEFGLSFRW